MGRKIWLGIKKVQFLVIFAVTGISFLHFSDIEDLYSGPAREICSFWGWASGEESSGEIALAAGREDPCLPTGKAAQEGEEKPSYQLPDGEIREECSENGPDAEAAKEAGREREDSRAGAEEALGGKETDPAEEAEGARALEASGAPAERSFQTVTEDYFQDALFIGDSRTVGMRDYGKFGEETTFYAATGLTIFKLFTAQIVEQDGLKKKINIEEALEQKQFAKIYIMIGINELGTGDTADFEEAYRSAVERIRELQPDAILYIQSILKVTEKRSNEGDYITNKGIIDRNEAISKLADGQSVFYLDINEALCDASGSLNPEYTSDGVHVKAKYIPIWKEFLMEHAIE